MARTLHCPVCMASLDQGYEFLVTEPYRAEGTGIVRSVDIDGAVMVEMIDRGDPDRFFTPRVHCRNCGHDWPTTRSIEHLPFDDNYQGVIDS